ncbi:MAG TPA: hypothetical protein VG992_01115 [Candidatus Saccharimonadales bacterium]|nr:hypothetical protein [Candidatus Saccharimonadales bacterium]
MATSKKYFHDHFVLLLLSINVFMALAGSLFIILPLVSGHGSNGYIVQCRDCSNVADANRFTAGNVTDMLGFVAFAAVVLVAHTMLSLRTYQIHRQLAVVILGLGALLLLLMIVVSNALLVLR